MHRNVFNHSERLHRSKGGKVLRIAGMTVFGVMAAVLFSLVFGLVVKWLWNWLMPAIFGLGIITFWQAFGIVLLAKLLFGGFGHHERRRSDDIPHEKISEFVHGDKKRSLFNHGNGKNWRLFRQYWEEEGRTAFDEYIRRKEKSENEEKNDE